MVPLLLTIHLLSAVFWVGGMAFAYLVLRPAAGVLDPAPRLLLWRRVFAGFLPWAGVAALLLLITGFWMVFTVYDGFANLPMHVNTMMGTGILMVLAYLHLLFAPWQRFKRAVDGDKLDEAARRLGQIRMIVAVNLVLGVITVAVAGGGRYLGM